MASYLTPGATQGIVHITAVDTVNRLASGMWSDGSECGNVIDTRYLIGGLQITPHPGDVWKVERTTPTLWRLVSQLPANDPKLSGDTTPAPGQQQVGGLGPLELHGSEINAHALIRLDVPDTLPDAVAAGRGAMVYNQATSQPVFSDGTVWRDAVGTEVP